MHVQRVQNNNYNNIHFGTLKGFVYEGEFNPANPDHAKIIDTVRDSLTIKRFGEKYDFLAQLTYYNNCTSIKGGEFYGLEFIPVPNTEFALIKQIRNIIDRWKNRTKAKSVINEAPQKEEKIKNLPVHFVVTNTTFYSSNNNIVKYFIDSINLESLKDIELSLKCGIMSRAREEM